VFSRYLYAHVSFDHYNILFLENRRNALVANPRLKNIRTLVFRNFKDSASFDLVNYLNVLLREIVGRSPELRSLTWDPAELSKETVETITRSCPRLEHLSVKGRVSLSDYYIWHENHLSDSRRVAEIDHYRWNENLALFTNLRALVLIDLPEPSVATWRKRLVTMLLASAGLRELSVSFIVSHELWEPFPRGSFLARLGDDYETAGGRPLALRNLRLGLLPRRGIESHGNGLQGPIVGPSDYLHKLLQFDVLEELHAPNITIWGSVPQSTDLTSHQRYNPWQFFTADRFPNLQTISTERFDIHMANFLIHDADKATLEQVGIRVTECFCSSEVESLLPKLFQTKGPLSRISKFMLPRTTPNAHLDRISEKLLDTCLNLTTLAIEIGPSGFHQCIEKLAKISRLKRIWLRLAQNIGLGQSKIIAHLVVSQCKLVRFIRVDNWSWRVWRGAANSVSLERLTSREHEVEGPQFFRLPEVISGYNPYS
jgi:hypothetical protein